ncbi:hypothetical protein MTR_7g029410 [Medicago truncatula]|uniref:RNase H type-1 domain-containing protein n=1 Tax=Medicago truncatula TaxID=3880 RepID=A0A072U869_MEDTR|nr:hypothetical protein MTR_7g029410 [Medicago truncatula]
MMLWCLWCRRNDKVWEGDLKPIVMVVQLASEVLAQWQTSNGTSTVHADVMSVAAPAQRQQQQETRKQPPNADYLKCNVDASIFEEQRSFGIGMCIRDSHGKASTKWYDGVPPPSAGMDLCSVYCGHVPTLCFEEIFFQGCHPIQNYWIRPCPSEVEALGLRDAIL